MAVDQNKEVHPILIIMGSNLNKSSIGEQFVDSMIKDVSKKSIVKYVLSNNLETSELDDSGVYTYVRNTSTSSLPLLSTIKYQFFRYKHLVGIISEIEYLIDKFKIQTIWLILNSEQLIAIGDKLDNHFSKLIIHIWDHPEYLIRVSRFDRFSRIKLMQKFQRLIKKTNHVVSIGEGMSQHFLEKYERESSILNYSVNVKRELVVLKERAINTSINMVFAGSLYSWKEWNWFIKSIEKWNRKHIEMKISLTFLGGASRFAKFPKWVKNMGMVSQKEALDYVSQSDISYLPYWFASRKRIAAETSFPSKMSFYISSGTPILFHGPKYATPYSFLIKYPVGIPWTSNCFNDFETAMNTLLSEAFRSEYVNNRNEVYNKYFEKNSASTRFLRIIETMQN